MKIQNVKGGYDFLPKEQKIRDYINSIIIDNFLINLNKMQKGVWYNYIWKLVTKLNCEVIEVRDDN